MPSDPQTTDIVTQLRDPEWRGVMQHCRAWSELDALHDQAANEIVRLRRALTQFVACCETAPPVSFMNEIGIACVVAKEALMND